MSLAMSSSITSFFARVAALALLLLPLSPRAADMSQTIHRGGPVLWVNQDAERYTNEGCGSFVPQCVGNAVHTQAESYLVMSKDVIDEFVARTGYEGLQADMDEAAAQCPGDNVYKADTIKELAELQGLDAAVFEATVERYNELCDKAVDEVIRILFHPADRVYTVRADAGTRAAEAADLARRVGSGARPFDDVGAAFAAARAEAGPDGLVVVAGSLYLVGTFKAQLAKKDLRGE